MKQTYRIGPDTAGRSVRALSSIDQIVAEIREKLPDAKMWGLPIESWDIETSDAIGRTLRVRVGGASAMSGEHLFSEDAGFVVNGTPDPGPLPRVESAPVYIALSPSLDALLDAFTQAMRAKLLKSEIKHPDWPKDGWRDPLPRNWAVDELRRHLDKGDPIDVANFAMFCWFHGVATTAKLGET